MLPLGVIVGCLLAASSVRAQDTIELLSGARVEGKVAKIDKTAREVTFTAVIAGRSLERVYAYDKIHAVTMGGKRYVLNEKTAAAPTGTSPTGTSTSSSSGSRTSTRGTATAATTSSSSGGRSRMEVMAMIDAAGKQFPDWFENTPLNYPQSLDLSWPQPPPSKDWNNQKNVGQYLWDVINPNTAKWREGVKFMHHLLTVNKDQPDVAQRAMNDLGRMYNNLLEDYPRAAFWFHQAGVHTGNGQFRQSGADLASCYYKMGNKQMAVELLLKLQANYGDFQFIKVWAELGELDTALKMAELYGKADVTGTAAMMAGDACRTAGRYQQAVDYYNKVISASDPKRADRNKKRAQEALDSIKQFELSDVRKVPDGAYRSSSQGYEAPIEVEVVVKGQRIESVRVTQHREKQFYSAMSDTPAKIIAKQGVKGVDATSNATITSEAIINATAKALASAQNK
jgi:uncharacterized protein with FMN-binding domain